MRTRTTNNLRVVLGRLFCTFQNSVFLSLTRRYVFLDISPTYNSAIQLVSLVNLLEKMSLDILFYRGEKLEI